MKHLKKFTVRSACGRWPMDCNRVLHMMKCRNGRGTGCRIGMMWSGETLTLAEQGIIIEESKKSHREPGSEG